MNEPHKHAALIKAWADGAEIQYYEELDETWYVVDKPSWGGHHDYRIKPEKKNSAEICRAAFNDEYDRLVKNDVKAPGILPWATAAQAVIDAYKRGEFDE